MMGIFKVFTGLDAKKSEKNSKTAVTDAELQCSILNVGILNVVLKGGRGGRGGDELLPSY